jgi:DNA-binding response OmpR family regulator
MRILILEDASTDADLVEFELMEAGLAFTLKRTVTEKEYLRELDDFSPDLILSDYDLPQYNGELALAEAKRRLPEVPFIMVSGALDDNKARVNKILVGGASGFVSKNHLEWLGPTVHKALKMKRST